MLRTFLFVALVIASLALVFLILLNGRDPHQPPLPSAITPIISTNECIEKINAKNKQIKTFSSDVVVTFREHGIPFKLTGTIAHEKDNCFRLRLRSVFGEELDIGSNQEKFWYWSRKDPHPGLYYSRHEDYLQTRLKTPFDPVFLKESLGVEVLQGMTAKFDGDKLILVWTRANASGKNVLKCVIIDKAMVLVDGLNISDMTGKPLASCRIEYWNNLPKKIFYNWVEEGKSMTMEFKNPRFNAVLEPNNWKLPDRFPQINMAEDSK